MSHRGSVLFICLSLRPVGSIHISCLAAREQTSAARIAKASPPYYMKYFYSVFCHYLSILFLIFLTEAAQYECSYRRTAHHATARRGPSHGDSNSKGSYVRASVTRVLVTKFYEDLACGGRDVLADRHACSSQYSAFLARRTGGVLQ